VPKAIVALVAACVAALLIPGVAPAAPDPAKASGRAHCAGADRHPAAVPLAKTRRATLCLLNAERRSRGLGPVKQHRRLVGVAAGYSRAMVRGRFFAHVSPAGSTMTDRILRGGYTRTSRWTVGENLAWGSGRHATPRRIVRAWMDSDGHRANVLRRSFRHIGIGVVRGTPKSPGAGATYTANFGRR
jgi:uncharacterized protein YkwD